MVRVDGWLPLIGTDPIQTGVVLFDINRVFCDFHIAKASIPHSLVSSEQHANARVVCAIDGTKVDIICRYWYVPFDHVIIFRISEVMI